MFVGGEKRHWGNTSLGGGIDRLHHPRRKFVYHRRKAGSSRSGVGAVNQVIPLSTKVQRIPCGGSTKLCRYRGLKNPTSYKRVLRVNKRGIKFKNLGPQDWVLSTKPVSKTVWREENPRGLPGWVSTKGLQAGERTNQTGNAEKKLKHNLRSKFRKKKTGKEIGTSMITRKRKVGGTPTRR